MSGADLLKAPEWWLFALFLPSLLALAFLLRKGFENEGPEPMPGRWTVIDLFAVIVIHVVSGSLLANLQAVPLLPRQLAIGIQLILVDAITCGAVLLLGWRTPEPDRSLGLRLPGRLRNLAAVAVTVAAFLPPLQLLVWAWLLLLHLLGLPPTSQDVVEIYARGLAAREWTGIAAIALGAVVAAPFMEELFFRGFIFGILGAWMGRRGALLLTSAAFAAFHVLPAVLLPIFLVGLVLNWIYLRTGSLAYPILFHALFNAANLIFLSWPA